MSGNVDDFPCKITAREMVGEDILSVRVRCPSIAESIYPGQFVLLRDPSWGMDPLLMRPFAVSAVYGEDLELLIKLVGRGTSLLAERSVGDDLVVRGPMGRGFSSPESSPIYVAGALGAAPLLFARQVFGVGRFVLGVPGEGWGPFVDYLEARCPEMEVFSDDGSIGARGTALDGLEKGESHPVYACGPMGMMAAIVKLEPLSCQVSLESRMACGIGACCGCVIETIQGKRRVCADGPVFSLEEVVWNA
jgi:dihydroorotate dehydrogenase electron transfer subunit